VSKTKWIIIAGVVLILGAFAGGAYWRESVARGRIERIESDNAARVADLERQIGRAEERSAVVENGIRAIGTGLVETVRTAEGFTDRARGFVVLVGGFVEAVDGLIRLAESGEGSGGEGTAGPP
jgi:hypothetical protein